MDEEDLELSLSEGDASFGLWPIHNMAKPATQSAAKPLRKPEKGKQRPSPSPRKPKPLFGRGPPERTTEPKLDLLRRKVANRGVPVTLPPVSHPERELSPAANEEDGERRQMARSLEGRVFVNQLEYFAVEQRAQESNVVSRLQMAHENTEASLGEIPEQGAQAVTSPKSSHRVVTLLRERLQEMLKVSKGQADALNAVAAECHDTRRAYTECKKRNVKLKLGFKFSRSIAILRLDRLRSLERKLLRSRQNSRSRPTSRQGSRSASSRTTREGSVGPITKSVRPPRPQSARDPLPTSRLRKQSSGKPRKPPVCMSPASKLESEMLILEKDMKIMDLQVALDVAHKNLKDLGKPLYSYKLGERSAPVLSLRSTSTNVMERLLHRQQLNRGSQTDTVINTEAGTNTITDLVRNKGRLQEERDGLEEGLKQMSSAYARASTTVQDIQNQDHAIFSGGQFLLKHGRRGSAHHRRVSVDRVRATVHFGEKTLSIHDVTEIIRGKETAVFQRNASSAAPSDCCFSIVTCDRTLDLQAPSTALRDHWCDYLDQILQAAE